MHTAVRPWMTAVFHVASAVETMPQALYSRFHVVTHHPVQTVKSRTPRHHRFRTMAPQAATPYVMLVASDITDQAYDIFA